MICSSFLILQFRMVTVPIIRRQLGSDTGLIKNYIEKEKSLMSYVKIWLNEKNIYQKFNL